MACLKASSGLCGLLSVVFLALVGGGAGGVAGAQLGGRVPAIYVFGDSTADVGNNNYLAGGGVARANFPHNGIDFPASRPTGRFSNGYNGIDFLALYMGLRRSPLPFLSLAAGMPHGQVMRGLKGVNFASAGSGILDSTGSGSITMTKQVLSFAQIQSNITARIAREEADGLLSRSIFLISTGGNDIFAFFLSKNKSPTILDRVGFTDALVSAYEVHVKALYSLGARRFGVVDVPPIGCCPYPRSLNPLGGCVDTLNELAQEVNNGVRALMHNLSSTLNGFRYSVGSSHQVVLSIIRNPGALGFEEIRRACCGAGRMNGESGCTPNATYCSNRNRFLFWDLLHPTHAASKIAAFAIYNGSLQFAAPINFRQLMEIQ